MAEPIDKDTRGPVNLRIKFRSESLQQFIERYGVDVSRGGIFIRTREPLPVGTRLKLDFQLVDTAPLFQGDGTVVWIREHDASRAGVTPGMGVRFDRLTPESQPTLDTILEEKIRLQQSGVAPGSIAKAGAGIAVRRPSGAFATLDAPGAKAPPPLPVEVRMDSPTRPRPAPRPPARCRFRRRAPVRTRRRGSSSIFSRPAHHQRHACAVPARPRRCSSRPRRTTSTRRCRSSRRRAARRPSLPPIVADGDRSLGREADQRRRPDARVRCERGGGVLRQRRGHGQEPGATRDRRPDGDRGRRRADPEALRRSGERRCDRGRPVRRDRQGRQTAPAPAATLDAPLASLVDSGTAPPAKPAAPPPSKPAASPASKPAASGQARKQSGVPMRITTDRPTATESGRFRSDARYKRARGKGLYWALAIAGHRRGRRWIGPVREARAREARGRGGRGGCGGAAPGRRSGDAPTDAAHPARSRDGDRCRRRGRGADRGRRDGSAREDRAAQARRGPSPRPTRPTARAPRRPRPPRRATTEKPAEGQTAPRRRRERAASATAGSTEKPAEGAAEKKPAGDEAKGGDAKGGERAEDRGREAGRGRQG